MKKYKGVGFINNPRHFMLFILCATLITCLASHWSYKADKVQKVTHLQEISQNSKRQLAVTDSAELLSDLTPHFLRKSFIKAKIIEGNETVSFKAFDPFTYQNWFYVEFSMKLKIGFFVVQLLLILIFLEVACVRNFRILQEVVRYLSTCGPEDQMFEASNSMRQPIDESQLEAIVHTIEDKLSIGIAEKRRKYFNAHQDEIHLQNIDIQIADANASNGFGGELDGSASAMRSFAQRKQTTNFSQSRMKKITDPYLRQIQLSKNYVKMESQKLLTSFGRLLFQVKNLYRSKELSEPDQESQVVTYWKKHHKFKNGDEKEKYQKDKCFKINELPIQFQDYAVEILCPCKPPQVPEDGNLHDETYVQQKEAYNGIKHYILKTLRQSMENLQEREKHLYLQRSTRAMMSQAITGCIMAVAFTLVFLRMYFFYDIGQEFSLIIGIVSTFIVSTAGEIKKNIEDPGSLLQVETIFKILKVCLIIMTLSYNGTVNDYFIGLFFAYTGMIGKYFFQSAGLYIAEKSYYQDEEAMESDVNAESLDNQQMCIYFDRVMTMVEKDLTKKINDENVQFLQFRSLICFFINVFLIYKLDLIFEFLGAGAPDLDFRTTTLGISSTIMILYNMVAWPYIHEKSELRPKIRMIKSELARANELGAQLDIIVNFCSEIMVQVKSLGIDKAPGTDVSDLRFNGAKVQVYDQNNSLIFEVRLKQLGDEDAEYVGYPDVELEAGYKEFAAGIEKLTIEENGVLNCTMRGQLYTYVQGRWFDDDPTKGTQYKVAKQGKASVSPVALYIKHQVEKDIDMPVALATDSETDGESGPLNEKSSIQEPAPAQKRSNKVNPFQPEPADVVDLGAAMKFGEENLEPLENVQDQSVTSLQQQQLVPSDKDKLPLIHKTDPKSGDWQ